MDKQRLDEIEKIAMRNGEMPDGLSWAEQHVFVSLRCLYWQYKWGNLQRDIASREKKRILKKSEEIAFGEKNLKYWTEQIRKTELAKAAYRKDRTIENADALVDVLDGLKRS